jgi:hypothetical protein
MVKKLLVILLILNCSFTYAATIKTDVLVIGNGPGAAAAAIQSARSKLKTVLLVKGGWLESMSAKNMITITAGRYLPSGIWGEFRKEVREFYKKTPRYDTTFNAALKFEPYNGAAILKKMADSVKGLTIKLNTPYTLVKKDGTGWEVTIITDGKTSTIKAKAIIDATETGEVVSKIGATLPTGFNSYRNGPESKLYRTSIAVGDLINTQNAEPAQADYVPLPVYYIPISAVIVKDADNLLTINNALPAMDSTAVLPAQFNVAQGVGCIAAYCAFFKTTTKNLKIRAIQIELLDFKGYVLPFTDIDQRDKYYRAMQQIGATGMLKGVQKMYGNEKQFVFMPDSVVATAEIKPVLTEIYSRAFLWFNKVKPDERFTVGNMLSLISEITLSEPKDFQLTMQKAWKTEYKFTSDFDLEHPITRREFAILANQFLNPFARTIDMVGRVVN